MKRGKKKKKIVYITNLNPIKKVRFKGNKDVGDGGGAVSVLVLG
jgi:hypothetical protein